MTPLGERLRAWRAAERLKQEDAATKLGVSSTSYQKYELGTSAPGSAAMEAFVTAGGINANWLLTGEGPMLIGGLQAAGWSGALDRARMRLAIEAVEEGIEEAKGTMAPTRKAELVLAVYDLMEEPSVTKEKVLQLIKFAA
jgi:transcriptional regulator with XRE-family HTH domain